MTEINLDEMEKAIDAINAIPHDPIAMIQMPGWQFDQFVEHCENLGLVEHNSKGGYIQGLIAGQFNRVPILINNYLTKYRIFRQSEIEKFNPFCP